MKLSTLVVLVPVTIVAAMIAIANREEVAFRFVPFVQEDSSFALMMPLFLLVFLMFLLGVLVGGATVALNRGRRRRKHLASHHMAKILAPVVAQSTKQPDS